MEKRMARNGHIKQTSTKISYTIVIKSNKKRLYKVEIFTHLGYMHSYIIQLNDFFTTLGSILDLDLDLALQVQKIVWYYSL